MSIATVDTNLPLIQQLLIERGVLDAKRLAASRNTPTQPDESPERWLCRLDLANDHEIAEAYAEYLGIPLYDPPESEEVAVDHTLALSSREALPYPVRRPGRRAKTLSTWRSSRPTNSSCSTNSNCSRG